MTADEQPRVTVLAEAVMDAIDAFVPEVESTRLPAPTVYDVLGRLGCIGQDLPDAFVEMAAGLRRSLLQYDVYDEDGDPRANVEAASVHLHRAAKLVDELGDALSAARTAITWQGFRTSENPHPKS